MEKMWGKKAAADNVDLGNQCRNQHEDASRNCKESHHVI